MKYQQLVASITQASCVLECKSELELRLACTVPMELLWPEQHDVRSVPQIASSEQQSCLDLAVGAWSIGWQLPNMNHYSDPSFETDVG